MSEELRYALIGTPFSTFTRTIALGLHYKGLKFKQIATRAQSEIAQAGHPFAYLPTLIIHGIDGRRVDVKLCESQAITRFIDRTAPEPSLLAESGPNIVIEEKMWEFVSLAASFGFPMIEAGVVKPRIKALDEGVLSEANTREQIKDGVFELQRYLAIAESLMAPDGFAFGDHPTWADFFLYPLLADLRMVPEWDLVSGRLRRWTELMDTLPAAQTTKPGTLSAGARP
ncbi:hypothetical protein BDN70DRAFT_914043 [Pholiota conissans]|uniref:Glutathione S-transferase n=1 Tax=Pholiota conissans TaxID=109636 RepID=A0A9P5YXM0_9AGAR|nr:hypothetical protein BDN70DRAFT_914043 [Pholiota conissans]